MVAASDAVSGSGGMDGSIKHRPEGNTSKESDFTGPDRTELIMPQTICVENYLCFFNHILKGHYMHDTSTLATGQTPKYLPALVLDDETRGKWQEYKRTI